MVAELRLLYGPVVGDTIFLVGERPEVAGTVSPQLRR